MKSAESDALFRFAAAELARLGAFADPASLVAEVSGVSPDGPSMAAVRAAITRAASQLAERQHSALAALTPDRWSAVAADWRAATQPTATPRPNVAVRSPSSAVPPLQRFLAEVPGLIRACTPSVMTDQPVPLDIRTSDISVSFDRPGSLLDRSNAFGSLLDDIAAVYGADRAWVGVGGSTTSNWIVARALAYLLPPGSEVLVARGAHVSVPQSLTDFDIPWRYLPGRYNQEFESVLPLHPDDLRAELSTDRETRLGVVMVNSPTYEGLVADLAQLRQVLDDRSPDTLLIVDEAWGSHLPAHPTLRSLGAAEHRVDLLVSSTHKQAGGLQGTSVIVQPRGSRIDRRHIEASVAALTTTSPSYLLLGSSAAVYSELRHSGARRVGELIEFAEQLDRELRHRTNGRATLADELDRVAGETSVGRDPLKVTVALTNCTLSGFDVADRLQSSGARRRIIVEKSGLNSIQLLVTFQMSLSDVTDIAVAVADIINAEPPLNPSTGKPLLADPFVNEMLGRADRHAATLEGLQHGAARHLLDSEHLTAGERVAAFPPGIPVVLEGDQITRDQINYLSEVIRAGGHLAGNGGISHSDGNIVTVQGPHALGSPVRDHGPRDHGRSSGATPEPAST